MSPKVLERAREVLQSIVQRLEPIEQEFSSPPGDFAIGHQGEIDPERYLASVRAGLFALRDALRDARAALASDDPEFLVLTALECQINLSAGQLLFYHRRTLIDPRVRQGKKSGESRRHEIKRTPYVAHYWALVDSGMPYLKARSECIALARRDGVSFPESVPSRNRWFPKPKVKWTGSINEEN
jgi:hypothetical protein